MVTTATSNKNDSPLISVITIVKNGADVLERTIQSVAGQSFRNFDYALIDGGSSDGTLDIIKKHRESLTVWISERDDGISDAFNKGIVRTHGKWIIFINAGDYFLDADVLKKFIESLQTSDQFDIVHGDIVQVDSMGQCLRAIGGPLNRRKFKFHISIPHQGIFHNRKFFNKYGLFNTNYKRAMDYELLTRKMDIKTLHIPIPVAATLVGGISQQNNLKLILELRKIRKKNIGPNTLLSDGRYFLTYVKVSIFVFLRKIFGEQFI